MRTSSVCLLAGCLAASGAYAQNQRIVQWVEDGPVNDSSIIALGYPVPIPVDTPLPFAGFRSYNGLHMRHQDLAATTPWVHPEEIGLTRHGRTIWAYRLGDEDRLTPDGLPEHALLTNGGIHAREWQSPEVATGIIELIAATEADNHLVSYLRDNANVIVIPVHNVDGFLQTQRYPRHNWLGTDPNDPEFSPRDGRMRRKSMPGADEDLFSQGDHLNGIDLNRNNAPFWATSTGSSANPQSLVYHGPSPQSEPETQALDVAADLGPAERLSLYTDMHSFSQVHFWVRTNNSRLTALTERVLSTFTSHQMAFPAGKWYAYAAGFNVPLNSGIGTTDEYFTHLYRVPSWTLEIEPTNGQPYHAPLPGSGADYGGLGRNGHDGFILPDAEVPRVRSELAQTFAVVYYRQAGPPALTALQVIDDFTGAVVLDAEWDPVSDTGRSLHSFQSQPLRLDRDYTLWTAFDKPMRWRENGSVAPLQGQPDSTLDFDVVALVGGQELAAVATDPRWLDDPGGAPHGYLRYRDDAFSIGAVLPSDANGGLIDGTVTATLLAATFDMTGQQTDADPATVARWENGGWSGYENDNGLDQTDTGGASSLSFEITSEALPDPFVVEAGTSSAWYDPTRNGEGFMLEILAGNRAVMYWFTYDTEGGQDWYIAVGESRGNRILFPELLQVSGGVFGPDFDPGAIVETVVGSASFIWSGCDTGAMKWQIGAQRGRMDLQRLSRVMGIDCGRVVLPPIREEALLSGSWYDVSHAGEGYTLEVLVDARLLVYWFGYGPDGHRRWFFGVGEIAGGVLRFDDMLTTEGGVFGPGFDPAQVEELPWGSLELEIGCDGGEARFTPTEAGFPAGTLNLTRLSALEGLECQE